MILYREDTVLSQNCICERQGQVTVQRHPVLLPKISRPKNIMKPIGRSSRKRTLNYHIIPLRLISEFFKTWLSHEFPVRANANFNGCVLGLADRLKRFIEKILIIRILNSRELSNEIGINVQTIINDAITPEMYGRFYGWLSGNIFVGPSSRGLFNPNFQRGEEELLEAIDTDAEYIIGHQSYLQIFLLYEKMLSYIRESPQSSLIGRIMNGFNIFTALAVVLDGRAVTPFNEDQWEEQEPTEEEFSRIKSEGLRKEMKTNKFWRVKKPRGRNPRSVGFSYYQYDKVNVSKEVKSSTMNQTKHSWNKFILDSLSILLDAHCRNEPLIWSCNMTRLYQDYLLHKSDTLDFQCASCMGFDKFLYLKILLISDWHACNSDKNSMVTNEWCQAWKRIVTEMESSTEIVFIDGKKLNYNQTQKSTSITHLNDVETLIRWISSKLDVGECEKTTTQEIILPHKLYQSHNATYNVVDTILCFLTTFAINECNKFFGKQK